VACGRGAGSGVGFGRGSQAVRGRRRASKAVRVLFFIVGEGYQDV
jgi:hypothetical protein